MEADTQKTEMAANRDGQSSHRRFVKLPTLAVQLSIHSILLVTDKKGCTANRCTDKALIKSGHWHRTANIKEQCSNLRHTEDGSSE